MPPFDDEGTVDQNRTSPRFLKSSFLVLSSFDLFADRKKLLFFEVNKPNQGKLLKMHGLYANKLLKSRKR